MTQDRWTKEVDRRSALDYSVGAIGVDQAALNQAALNQKIESDASTLTEDVNRLHSFLHAIGEDLVAVHVSLFGPENTTNAKWPEPNPGVEGRISFMLRLAEAIVQETSSLRSRLG